MKLEQIGVFNKPVISLTEKELKEQVKKVRDYLKYRNSIEVSKDKIKQYTEEDSIEGVYKQDEKKTVLNMKKGYLLVHETDLQVKTRKSEIDIRVDDFTLLNKDNIEGYVYFPDIVSEKNYHFTDSMLLDLYVQAFYKEVTTAWVREQVNIPELKGFTEVTLPYADAETDGKLLIPLDIEELEQALGKSLEYRHYAKGVEKLILKLEEEYGYKDITAYSDDLQEWLDKKGYTAQEQEELIVNSLVFKVDFITMLVPYPKDNIMELDDMFAKFEEEVNTGLRVSKRLKTGLDYKRFNSNIYGFSKSTMYVKQRNKRRSEMKDKYSITPLWGTTIYNNLAYVKQMNITTLAQKGLVEGLNQQLAGDSMVVYLGTLSGNRRDLYNIVSTEIETKYVMEHGFNSDATKSHRGILINLGGNVIYVSYDENKYTTAKDFYYEVCTGALEKVFSEGVKGKDGKTVALGLPKCLLNSVGVTSLYHELIKLRDKPAELRSLTFFKYPFMTKEEYEASDYGTKITLP